MSVHRAVLLLSLLGLLAACGSSDGSSSASAATTSVLATAAATTPSAAPATTAPPTTTPPTTAPPTTISEPHLTYLALGDSHVYGLSSDCGGCTSYPNLLVDSIAKSIGEPVLLIDASQHIKLNVATLAGEVSDDSWIDGPEPIRTELSPRTAIGEADLITLTIGANDLPWYNDPDPCAKKYDQQCIDKIVPRYLDQLDRLLTDIDSVRGANPAQVRITTMFNDTIVGETYKAWFYGSLITAQATTGVKTLLDSMNAGICAEATAHGAVCIDLYHDFNGLDGTSPMDDGYFQPNYGDLNQRGQDQAAAAILAAGIELR